MSMCNDRAFTRRMDLQTLEDVPRLDVAALLSGGPVDVGTMTMQAVSRGAAIALSWVRPDGGKASQCFVLACYPLPLGGSKTMIVCSCGCRVRSLFLNRAGDTWGCRYCLGLRYQSQRRSYPTAREGAGCL